VSQYNISTTTTQPVTNLRKSLVFMMPYIFLKNQDEIFHGTWNT